MLQWFGGRTSPARPRRLVVKRTLCVATVALALVAVPAAAAHNIAHHFLPDGTCVEVGAGNSPADQAVFQVDKIPSTVPAQDANGEWIRDEFGTRWVADPSHPGSSPLERGGCPA
jgi:hypothetical protein